MTGVIALSCFAITLLRYYEGPFEFSEATREFHSLQIDLYQGLCGKERIFNALCDYRGHERQDHEIFAL